jgi:hypothetical protein
MSVDQMTIEQAVEACKGLETGRSKYVQVAFKCGHLTETASELIERLNRSRNGARFIYNIDGGTLVITCQA